MELMKGCFFGGFLLCFALLFYLFLSFFLMFFLHQPLHGKMAAKIAHNNNNNNNNNNRGGGLLTCPLMGGGRGLLTCLYPLKVQACPPRDQRLATQSKISGREESVIGVGQGGGGGV